jgi:superfamily II DNA or RNA helicase
VLADLRARRERATLHGDMRPAERRAAHEQLTNPDGDGERLVLATGRYIGEGFDDPLLDAMLLAMPIAWEGTVIQYAGRLHRAHPDKRDVLIYDYVDAQLQVLRRMFAKRLRAYRSLGYELVEPAPGPMAQAPEADATEVGLPRRHRRDQDSRLHEVQPTR